LARKETIQLVDDIDGTDADETVEFGLDGVVYTIDLATPKAARLRAVLEEFRAKARHIRGRRRPGRSAAAGPDPAQVREWAATQPGMTVNARGRIPLDIVEAYKNRETVTVAATRKGKTAATTSRAARKSAATTKTRRRVR
jgi:hypothetical protein